MTDRETRPDSGDRLSSGSVPIPALERPPDAREATICYPLVGQSVLLIRKKRGIGAGVHNGPGGKLEDDESPRDCAGRETREEVGVGVDDLEKRGEFSFYQGPEPTMHIHVYVATEVTGEPTETPEADPVWVDIDDLPLSEMWESDRLWVPRVLGGESFVGTIQFDAGGEELRSYDLLFGDRVPDAVLTE